MLKKFVPLDGEVAFSQTPYTIKTYKCPAYEELPRPLNIDPCCYDPHTPLPVPAKRVLTTEEAILQLLEIPHKPRFQLTYKKRCPRLGPFKKCVMTQRTPSTLKHQNIVREKYLNIKMDMMERVHDATEPLSEEASVVEMESPKMSAAKVVPQLASPACSLDAFYVPSRKLLDLKRPRSGVFINEKPRPEDRDLPYETYNPRQLQEQLEKEGRKKYTLLSDGEQLYFPWMKGDNIGDSKWNSGNASRQDSINFRPVIFPIPTDLHRTFRAAVVFSNNSLLPSGEEGPGPQRPVEVACLYVAFVESFAKNPDYWSANTMDSILERGVELHQKSIAINYENPGDDFAIFPELTQQESTVAMKLHLSGALNDEPNILKALTLFFHKFSACVLCSASLYFLIWKRCENSFYIFDPNGRDVECKRNHRTGKASLMAIETVEHIVHLILNYSGISNRSDFNLYDIHLIDFGKLSRPHQILEDYKPPKKLYAVVNKYYSVIPALSGLPVSTGAKSLEDNPSMMTSYLALVYSQIDPPRLWTMTLVDDLIKFGRKYHFDYVSDNRLERLNIVDLPEVLLFGNYRVLVEKKAFVISGHVVNCWSYRLSQLTQALTDFFSEYNSGLLQVDNSTFGLWRENEILMVFDPFRRQPSGQAVSPAKSGTGCVQMHLNVDSLCRIMFMNAKVIKSEGNFFLHGICVKAVGTFNINRARQDAAGFGILQIKYPFDCYGASMEPEQECEDKASKADFSNCTILQCLSVLSLNPCGRSNSEYEFVQMQRRLQLKSKVGRALSIQSIPDKYRIPEYDNIDVIDSVVAEFVSDLMSDIQKRTEKKNKVCIEASKILLKSDIGHLKDLKIRLKRGEDYDNICVAFPTKRPEQSELTLENELAMDSNFTTLPDGCWAIFGITFLETTDEPLNGILSTITAAALSSKYNVSTWSSDVIEYALEASKVLQDRFWSYNHTLDLIFRKQIPKLQLGSATFALNVLTTETVSADSLYLSLEQSLLIVPRLFLICKGLSCLVVRRYNLIYMFMGCPCDVVGFKSKSAGPMCVLRFVELTALVRRIENACSGRYGKYVIVQLDVRDVTVPPAERFKTRTPSQEQIFYSKEAMEKERQKQRYKDKVKFIQDEIKKESKRVLQFQKAKSKLSKDTVSSSVGSSASLSGEYGEGELSEDSEQVEFKHKPGRALEHPEEEEMEDEPVGLPQIGYELRDEDFLFKIQGTTALENRSEAADEQIKACFFASSVALLYAILRPLNHWDCLRVDKVIKIAENIYKTTANVNTANERIIKNVDVDEFIFNVKVQVFTPMGTFGGNLAYKIMKTVQTQRYFLIQISNTTYAVYHDEYFHLFDPYPSMELIGEPKQTDPILDESIPRRREENTASWILFGELDAMMEYIEKRAVSKDWKTEYRLHTVHIISYKTAPKRIQLLNLLTDEIGKQKESVETSNMCTHSEEVEWLDIYPNLVIWSRLNRCNAVQRIRGSAFTKDRNFDIEIPDKLYSLWGSLHPESAVFGEYRGKQHLAIDVVACCVANVYQINEWNTQILDTIVINGNNYFRDSMTGSSSIEYEFSLEHLNTSFVLGHLQYNVSLESVTYGYLYSSVRKELNLAAALTYFFTTHRYGIIQCMKRSVAIGKIDSGFFMFDCQSHGLPLFYNGQGAAYVLRVSHLQTLLYCIVMTFNIPYYNAVFYIHKVDMVSDVVEEESEEDEAVEEPN